jgi:nicotinamidase-related amidase
LFSIRSALKSPKLDNSQKGLTIVVVGLNGYNQMRMTEMAKPVLLVIDAQKIYTEKDGALACKDASKTLENINKLVGRFAEKGLPVIYVRHQHKKDGSDTGRLFDYKAEGEGDAEFNFVEGSDEVQYAPKLKLLERRREIIKNRYSAFANTKLNQILTKIKATRVVICGFMTNFCCESTARDVACCRFG